MRRPKLTDRVAISRKFLRSTGQITGWAPFARGVVTGTQKFGDGNLLLVKWDDGSETRVLDTNLVLEKDLPLERT